MKYHLKTPIHIFIFTTLGNCPKSIVFLPLLSNPMARPVCFDCNQPKSVCCCEALENAGVFNLDIFPLKVVVLRYSSEEKCSKNSVWIPQKILSPSFHSFFVFTAKRFENIPQIQNFLNNCNCFVLFPEKSSTHIQSLFTSELQPDAKEYCVFIIDATWPSAKRILSKDKNPIITELPRLSLNVANLGKSRLGSIRKQPNDSCFCTAEAIAYLFKEISDYNIASVPNTSSALFLKASDAILVVLNAWIGTRESFYKISK